MFCEHFDKSVCNKEAGEYLYERNYDVKKVLEMAAKNELDEWKRGPQNMTVYCQILLEAGVECIGCDDGDSAFEDAMYRIFRWEGVQQVKRLHQQKYAPTCSWTSTTTNTGISWP